MCKFFYHIHYRPMFTMDKLKGLSKGSEKQKSQMDAQFVDENCYRTAKITTFGKKRIWKMLNCNELM